MQNNDNHLFRVRIGWVLLGLVVLAPSPPATAAESAWSLCGAPFAGPAVPASEADTGDAQTVHISADEADLDDENVSTLVGNVHLQRGAQHIAADRVVYNRGTDEVDARGNVRFWDEGLFVSGEHAFVSVGEDRAELDRAEFLLLDAHGRGEAERIIVHGEELVLVERARYTTCNPDGEAWVLEASDIELNRATDVGAARNVWVRFQRVPIFYSPFLTFPLGDERKSGFLPPKVRVSGSSGLELSVPYYLNLAPNRDATIAARAMSDRGVQAQGEYRYLMRWGEGQLSGEYLPNDRRFGDHRASARVRHYGSFAPRWSTDIDASWVSDDDYLEDLGTNLGIASRTHLERRGDVLYSAPWWWARGRVQDYQTLDDTLGLVDRPYESLPQLFAATALVERNRRLNFAAHAEFVRFERDASVTGNRVDLRPSVRYPMRTPASFLVPEVAARFTQYDLSGTAPGADDSPARVIPTFSLDGGLFFERDLHLGGRSLIQTLEPRAYYLFTPFDRQADQPIFDTGQYSFDFAQLFRADRFSGADRVGDANQVTVALTSRLLSPDGGQELVRASVGQIRFLRDRKVTLPELDRETDSSSDLVAEVGVSAFSPWRLLAGIQWDTTETRTNKSSLSLRYQPGPRRVINAAYRFVREARFTEQSSIEQADLSLAWPLWRNWRVVGRWNYALAEATTLESFAGLEYDSCCWALRTLVRRYLSSDGGDHTNAFFLQLELKGLTGIGRDTVDFLERSIPGYENEF